MGYSLFLSFSFSCLIFDHTNTTGQTQDLLLECSFIQKEFLPLERLDLMLVSLRQCWLKALTRNHLLQHTLRTHFVSSVLFNSSILCD